MTDETRDDESRIDRRKLLRGAGATGASILGLYAFTGTAGARGPPGRGNGSPGRGPDGDGPPGQSCNCDETDGEFIAKYDFECIEEDEDGCVEWGFVLAEGEDVVNIEVVEVKDGDDSEPITVEFEADGYVVQSVCAYGGRDTDTTEDEDGVERFETDLTNPGGQQAAISNLTFCGVVDDEDPECADLEAEYTCTVEEDDQILGTRHLVTNNGDKETEFGWAIIDSPDVFRVDARTVDALGTQVFTSDSSSPIDGVVWWEDDEGCDEILTSYAEFRDARGEDDDLITYIEEETAGIPDEAYVTEIDGYPVTDDNRVICNDE